MVKHFTIPNIKLAEFHKNFEWLKHYQYLSPYYAKKSAEVVQVSYIANNKYTS